MAKKSLLEQCKGWGYDEWKDFDNPIFQATIQKLLESEQQQILMQKNLFWACYNGNSNPISEGENTNPEDSWEEYVEEGRKKQEQFIKERGASFVFYHSFIEALEDMDDKNFRTCILALTDYGLYRKEGEYKGIVKMYMTQAKPQLDANERKKITARINGEKGGAPLGNQNARKDF
jgi:hypothetical protein